MGTRVKLICKDMNESTRFCETYNGQFEDFLTILYYHFKCFYRQNGKFQQSFSILWASFCLFLFFSNTNFTKNTVGFSRIRTQIVRRQAR